MKTKVKMNIGLNATKKKLNKELKELSGNQEKKESVGNFYVDMVCGLRREETKKGIKQHIKDLFSNEEKEN